MAEPVVGHIYFDTRDDHYASRFMRILYLNKDCNRYFYVYKSTYLEAYKATLTTDFFGDWDNLSILHDIMKYMIDITDMSKIEKLIYNIGEINDNN